MDTVVFRSPTNESVPSSNHARTELIPEDLGFRRLSDEEHDIWTAWLPAHMDFDTDVTQLVKTAKARYGLPDEALDEIMFASESGFFTAYSLHVPERTDLRDPLITGTQEGRRYAIALWGESLKPFEEIRQLVMRARQKGERFRVWKRVYLLLWLPVALILMVPPDSFSFGHGDWYRIPALLYCLAMMASAPGFLLRRPVNVVQDFLDPYRS